MKHSENVYTAIYHPSHLENRKVKHDYFEVSGFETKLPQHDNPQY